MVALADTTHANGERTPPSGPQAPATEAELVKAREAEADQLHPLFAHILHRHFKGHAL